MLFRSDAAGSTLVAIHTSLNVTGRPAQFGRSLLPEVSGKLIAQFATNLEALIASDNTTAEEAATPESDGTAADSSGETVTAAAKPAPAPVIKQEESLNAFKFVVVPILKRLIPVAAVGAGAAAIAVIFRRFRSKKSLRIPAAQTALWPWTALDQRGPRADALIRQVKSSPVVDLTADIAPRPLRIDLVRGLGPG